MRVTMRPTFDENVPLNTSALASMRSSAINSTTASYPLRCAFVWQGEGKASSSQEASRQGQKGNGYVGQRHAETPTRRPARVGDVQTTSKLGWHRSE